MNTISFDVIIEEEKEYLINNKETWNFGIEVTIDGNKIYRYKHFPIDILELIKTKNLNGDFFIFTCNCGFSECGGVDSISVAHKDNKVFWIYPKNKFEFSEELYQLEINNLIEHYLNSYDLLKKSNVEISFYPNIFLEEYIGEKVISKIEKTYFSETL